MKKKLECCSYYLDRELLRKGVKKLGNDEISISLLQKRKKLDLESTNKVIYDGIMSGKPFLVGRFGANELSMMKTIEFDIKSKYSVCTEMMHTNAGFFPNDTKCIKGFLPLMLDFCRECDVLGTWNQPFEGYFIKCYMKKNVILTQLENLEPWYYPDAPWSAALEGKKVLLIHPFTGTIKNQYRKQKLLFPKTDILPRFELQTLKAVQTYTGMKDERFKNWFEALEWMYTEAMKKEFDIAILGCGAYGAPLAAKIKLAGKQAIHLGGATQLLFGIKGKRWDGSLNSKYNYIQGLFNESWSYPLECDKIEKANEVENGCYW